MFRKLWQKLFGKKKPDQAEISSGHEETAASGVENISLSEENFPPPEIDTGESEKIKLGSVESPVAPEEPPVQEQKVGSIPEKADSGKIRIPKKKTHIQVGLDYGTSSTKIVYADVGGRSFRPICYNHGLPHYPDYVIPSALAIDDRGSVLIGIDAAKYLADKSWQEGLLRLKMIVAGRHDTAFREPGTEELYQRYLEHHGKNEEAYGPEKLTAIFLAYAMRQARIAIENSPEYQNQDLDLAFNINMPIEHRINNKVSPVFEKIFTWAEAIERYWPEDADNSVLPKIAEETADLNVEDRRVFAVPESVAGIASYLNSLAKGAGLHAVIDIGAGTTDVSIFNLMKEMDGSYKNYWYAARNVPWGMVHVEHLIAEQISGGSLKENTCSGIGLTSFLSELSKRNVKKGNPTISEMKEKIKNEFEKFCRSRDGYKSPWMKAYGHLQSQLAWEKVHVFLCGGGSKLTFIDKVFSVPWCYPTVKGPFSVGRIPEPDNYDSVSGRAPFQRMTVAYGLAIPIPKWDDFVLPPDAPDHTPPPLPVREAPDHENLYPR